MKMFTYNLNILVGIVVSEIVNLVWVKSTEKMSNVCDTLQFILSFAIG